MSDHDEGRRPARIATISALMVVAAFVAGKAARDAILLSHFSIRSLPLFIGIAALLSFPVIIVAGRLMTRFGPARLVPVLNVLSAALAVVEWLLLDRYPRVIAVAVFIHLSTASAVLVSGFWSIVNERFDVRTAKRHIGRIGMGATLGGIFGGVLAERTAVLLDPDMILLILAGLQLVCGATLFAFGRGTTLAVPEAVSDSTWVALRNAARAPLLRNVGAIVVLGAVAAGLIDYVFKADIVASTSPDGLLRSLAVFYTVTNVVTAIVQLAVCGPIIARLGVPRSVATLPFAVSAFGLLALLIPVPLSAALARAAELVTRNSIYRSAYELLYAPLPEESKRPTKVVLDVGADKVGDILGAQLVGLIVFVAFDVRVILLLALVTTGLIALLVAMRLPRNYTKALESSLLVHASEVAAEDTTGPAQSEPWVSLNGIPSFGSPDAVPLRLRARSRRERSTSEGSSSRWRKRSLARALPSMPAPRTIHSHDPVIALIADLRSPDIAHVRHALAGPMIPEVAPHLIELVGSEDVGREAVAALGSVAPACTGVLADALLDLRRPAALRRRIPAVLVLGEPALAAWALWRSLSDPDFDVRYRAGAMLSRLAVDGHLAHVSAEDVFEAVRRELLGDPREWRTRQLVDDPVVSAHGDDEVRAPSSLEHVFRVLALVLPAEPLRISLHAMQVDDPALRATALEYLESILPPDVRVQLWPLLGTDDSAPPSASSEAPFQVVPRAAHGHRSIDELLAALSGAYPSIVSRLRQRRTN